MTSDGEADFASVSNFQTQEADVLGLDWSPLFNKYGLCDQTIEIFRSEINQFYLSRGRAFSWRSHRSPYRVLVSEIMLQQTQTRRVEVKFTAFIDRFPGFEQLAEASFSEVLRYWKGLGYNRRAKYLHDISGLVVAEFDGKLPSNPQILVGFPGIGKATASSICVFAFNKPHAFIETNIRTVFIHFFFANQTNVDDHQIMALVDRSMDRDNPRQWFYALMDYGVMLKKSVGNLSRKSRHYHKQSRFQDSDRQLRGKILDLLLKHKQVPLFELPGQLAETLERLTPLAQALCREGLVVEEKGVLTLA